MKRKIGWAIFILAALGLISVYIFIPSEIRIINIAIVRCPKNGADRFLMNNDNWKVCWPGTLHSKENNRAGQNEVSVLLYKNDSFEIAKKNFGWTTFLVNHYGYKGESKLSVASLAQDSISLVWQCELEKLYNPISKILQYNQAVRLKQNMQEILLSLKSCMQKEENIYGWQIQKTTLEDTILVAKKQTTQVSPTTAEIYNMFASLKSYIKSQNARPTGRPMLNITKITDNEFQTMVAIPIDKDLPSKGDIMQKKMVPGNFLSAEVTGGQYTVDQALAQIQFYIKDHNMMTPAIPFQSLITDRTLEPDTSKWVTKLYAPVY